MNQHVLAYMIIF